MRKLLISLSFSKLVVTKLLTAIALPMRNFIANFVRILGICRKSSKMDLVMYPRVGVSRNFPTSMSLPLA